MPPADDQRRRLVQIDTEMLAGLQGPVPLPLRLQVVQQSPRQRQHNTLGGYTVGLRAKQMLITSCHKTSLNKTFVISLDESYHREW